MKKYEYLAVHSDNLYNSFSSLIDIDYLNNKGDEGWKLVSIVNKEAIFIREVNE